MFQADFLLVGDRGNTSAKQVKLPIAWRDDREVHLPKLLSG
jgi:hypothetical protein